jgi:pimeloyl-ACP methyl ester carboxylesterase
MTSSWQVEESKAMAHLSQHRSETATVPVGDMRFTAEIAGPAAGDLVLLLHGFPQTRHTWRAELQALADAGYRACAPDQRGYSAGARPSGRDAYRIENLVADVLAMADALGAERFHLVGHDWGGHIAWSTAALHPDRIQTLAVLSRPHPAAFAKALGSDDRQSKRSGHHVSFQRAEATDELLADNAAGLRSLFARSDVPDEDAEAYLSTLGERDALDAALNWYRAAGASSIRAADLPAVVRPTLYVWGDADGTVGRAAALATSDFVEAAYRFEALPGIGHFITDQAPSVFPPLLVDHLRTNS